jgi:hypothetical protein
MRTFEKGQKVIIKGADHSWPVDEMYNMIGTVHTIGDVSTTNSYRIGMYTWSWRDLELTKANIPKIKAGKFDPGELW